MAKGRAVDFCKHCGRVWGLHGLPDMVCPGGENTFVPRMPKGYDTKAHLAELVHHCWIYDGYSNCGYNKMSAEMKALYYHCIDNAHE